jgi:hypothetical protein
MGGNRCALHAVTRCEIGRSFLELR